MAERLVHNLEAVQIDVHDGDPQAVAMRLRHRLCKPVLHQEAVRKPGEHVIVGEELRPLFGALAFADVARSQNDAADAGMLEQIVAQRLEMDPGTIGVAESQYQRRRRRLAFQQGSERATCAPHVLGVKGLKRGFADQGAGWIAQHTRGRG